MSLKEQLMYSPPIMPQVSLAPPPLCSVPPLFRKPFIVSGYRLFQVHNETINVWSHLLAAGVLGFKLQGPEGQGLSVDVSSLPLVLHHLSTVTYLSCSAAAHRLQPRSEPARRSLVLVDRVGVAIYQYGCAVALCLYSVDTAWTQSMLGQVYLPAAALLAWCSGTICPCAQLCFQHRRLCHMVCQVLLVGVAHVWVIVPWFIVSPPAGGAILLCYFCCPRSSLVRPECFFPGHCDIVGQGHQIFHVLLALCTLVQQEALFRDFLWRRPGRLLKSSFPHHWHYSFNLSSLTWNVLKLGDSICSMRKRANTAGNIT
uniref:Progestin and adipoQ receptor family member 8 n=1 Tax=Takifugu rubripes TaxID=31033 RepID=A0A674PBA0_TAKRU